MSPRGQDSFSELSVIFGLFLALLQVISFMNVKTRSQVRNDNITSVSAESSRKLDGILAMMDVLITAKNDMLSKLDKLEIAQSTIIKT